MPGPPVSRLGGPPRIDSLRTAPALIVVATIRSSNPMVDAMVKRAKTDPKAKQMLEGLHVVAAGSPVHLGRGSIFNARVAPDRAGDCVDDRPFTC